MLFSGVRKYLAAVFCLVLLAAGSVRAERIKDLASIAGIRNNQLTGYGLVVGLDGSGDQTTQTPFTVQSIINMLANMGISMPTGTSLQLKNVAAVMVTATLPPFAQPGQAIDITVSSIGNAKSLRGGTLVLTPLKGADGNIYAMAQGSVLVSGAGATPAGARPIASHLSVGRITDGATVERAVPTPVGQGEFVTLELNGSDFGTAQRIVEVVNKSLGGNAASALDGRQIRVRAPTDPDQRVSFLARLQEMEVEPVRAVAKVIVNARTGSVVMNQLVSLQNCAVAHGNLSVTVGTAQAGGAAPATPPADGGSLINVKQGASLAEVVKALNAIGANPQDLVAILQAMKAAGALRAELEII
ncbi:MAG: flagellar basal body P-ring protein FlgI [Rhodocyclaceae bacterium]|nr:flagellar basal body P-ring protein FlgI [Rhodocyclaceae bacterium]